MNQDSISLYWGTHFSTKGVLYSIDDLDLG